MSETCESIISGTGWVVGREDWPGVYQVQGKNSKV